METKEKIKVFIDFQNGKTVCICKRSRKRCGKNWTSVRPGAFCSTSCTPIARESSFSLTLPS